MSSLPKARRRSVAATPSAHVFAELFLDVAFDPLERPFGGPRPSVRARVVDRDFVPQRIEVGAREALREPERLGVRQSAVRKPEAGIEAARFDDERVAVPP